ncbi:MAG: hypothetical protein L0Y72_30610 [Gemmataceae bacterium]|nr:hypothetical protein [Gemmataceae bacterium]MCI0743400.1 hypothetical protein [Gemmataceae bacterium]
MLYHVSTHDVFCFDYATYREALNFFRGKNGSLPAKAINEMRNGTIDSQVDSYFKLQGYNGRLGVWFVCTPNQRVDRVSVILLQTGGSGQGTTFNGMIDRVVHVLWRRGLFGSKAHGTRRRVQACLPSALVKSGVHAHSSGGHYQAEEDMDPGTNCVNFT